MPPPPPTPLEQVLGPCHPATASCLCDLAARVDDLGRLGEAEELYRQALGIRREVLGPRHPDTAACLTCLTELLRQWGRVAEAEQLLGEYGS